MSIPPLLNGPIPAYNNPIPQPQFYQPSRFVISDITIGITTLVTTSVAYNYVIGQQVRLFIPEGYGCRELSGQQAYVISLPTTTQMELALNSQFATPFVAANLNQSPQIMAIGDINSGQINSNGLNNTLTFIPGSFQDISPL